MLKNIISAVLIVFLFVLPACESPLQTTKKYSVTYSGNGNTSGQAPVDSKNYEAGTAITISSKGTLAKTGYTFSGWNTLADGSGTDWAVGTFFVIGSVNITLYAKWISDEIITPTFNKVFSGTTNLVFDSFVLPTGLYKIEANTTGFFQLFDVGNNKTIFNLSSGRAINAETFFKSNGGSYTFKTANTSSNWTVTFLNLDFTDPKPISVSFNHFCKCSKNSRSIFYGFSYV